MNLPASFPVKYKKSVRLSRHTSFRIGGPAQFWAEPEDAGALADLLIWCKKHKIHARIIGAGSNILVSDRGVSGVVVKLNSPGFCGIQRIGNTVIAGAGKPLAGLIAFCTREGLSGVEPLNGIPGTVGGAVVGNAGTKDKAIGDLVEFAVVMDYNGNVLQRQAADLDFSYRHSNLGAYVVLQVGLKLIKKNPTVIRDSISRYARMRRVTQGAGWRSAGCCFKNPEGDSAGRLIDVCGFKGKRCGHAVVSKLHANFIMNEGNATASDVAELMRRIIDAVKKRFRIRLEPEIQIWR